MHSTPDIERERRREQKVEEEENSKKDRIKLLTGNGVSYRPCECGGGGGDIHH